MKERTNIHELFSGYHLQESAIQAHQSRMCVHPCMHAHKYIVCNSAFKRRSEYVPDMYTMKHKLYFLGNRVKIRVNLNNLK